MGYCRAGGVIGRTEATTWSGTVISDATNKNTLYSTHCQCALFETVLSRILRSYFAFLFVYSQEYEKPRCISFK